VSDVTLPLPTADLNDGVVRLRLREITSAIPERGWVPAYHFTIERADSGDPVGLLRFRIGTSEWISLYAGHVGYAISEPHRGRRYASRALRLLLPLARLNEITPIWITCDPGNLASRRTCELAGARFISTVPLSPGNDMYERGDRFKCRYRLDLDLRAQ